MSTEDKYIDVPLPFPPNKYYILHEFPLGVVQKIYIDLKNIDFKTYPHIIYVEQGGYENHLAIPSLATDVVFFDPKKKNVFN